MLVVVSATFYCWWYRFSLTYCEYIDDAAMTTRGHLHGDFPSRRVQCVIKYF
jgi:hypothetical protein